MSVWRRIWRVRMVTAILLVLPMLGVCIWYGQSAVTAFYSYRALQQEKPALNWDYFQLMLHDQLGRDLKWLSSDGNKVRSRLPVLRFDLGAKQMRRFLSGAGKKSGRPFAKSTLKVGKKGFSAKIRIRGSRHWHFITKKKSMKVILEKGGLFDGYETFNLINQATPMMVGQKVISDIARDFGVLLPEYRFVRVVLNGTDLGIFHFQGQPDRSLFRKNKVMFGALFSGNPGDTEDPMSLWSDPAAWKEVTVVKGHKRLGQKALSKLLSILSRGSLKEFAEYAQTHMDMEAFARFEAIDVVFGIEQHGFVENQKLLYDPYLGQWRPVAWDLKGFKHDGVFNRAENPIFLRLKMLPQYRLLRDRLVNQLLTHQAAYPRVERMVRKTLRKLAPEVAGDRYLSAYGLLPKVSSFAYRMVRPLSMKQMRLAARRELMVYRKRTAYLKNQFRKNPLAHVTYPTTPMAPIQTGSKTSIADEGGIGDGPPSWRTELDLVVANGVAASVEGVKVDFVKGCEQPRFSIFQDGRQLPQEGGRLEKPLLLYANAQLARRQKGDADLQKIKLVNVPSTTRLVIESSCAVKRMTPFGTSPVNGMKVVSAPLAALPTIENPVLSSSTTPDLLAPSGAVIESVRSASLSEPLVMGPGKVVFNQTHLFPKGQEVVIQPGTDLKLGKDVSLIFAGKVTVRGAPDAMVTVSPYGDQPFGGMAFIGQGVAGSSITNLSVSGGSVVNDESVVYPAMVNLHGADNVTFRSCRFSKNRGTGDLFHAAYAKGLLLERVMLEDGTNDSVDLEFVDARISQLWVNRSGDECIDLMNSKLVLTEGVLLNCGGNAISLGQKSRVSTRDVAIAFGHTGLLVKGGSRLNLQATLLYHPAVGLERRDYSNHYEGRGDVTAEGLFVVGAKSPVRRNGHVQGSEGLDDGVINYGFGDVRPLRNLMVSVLRRRSVDGLVKRLNELEKQQ